MAKRLLFIFFIVMAVELTTAQERQYTDREIGGSSNGIVGSIDDEFSVTPTGQASYEIPIPALPGTGGVAPKISICYNGSTKEGLAGYGFDLQGLSIIHRIPSNVFDDGIATAVNFSDTDHFALDGCRLVRTAFHTMTETEYRTEIGGDIKVIAYGDMLDPTSFTAYTKSGLVIEYKSSVELLNGSQPNSLFWLATKVSDRLGNYYTVAYEGEASENDFRPSKIEYTGNDNTGLVPYASIRFAYYNRNTIPITYIGGEKISKHKILSSISLYYGDSKVREFSLSYINKDNHKLLESVKESCDATCHKNPTSFTWTEAGDPSLTKIEYSTTSSIHKATLAIGDFNGDGKTDFIAIPQDNNAGWKGWRIFTSTGKGVIMASSGSWHSSDDKIEDIITGDFNGDGLSDVVVKRNYGSGYHDMDLYLTEIDEMGLPHLVFHSCPLANKNDYSIHTANIKGSGTDDVIVLFSKSSKCRIYMQDLKGEIPTPLSGYVEKTFPDKWDKVEFGDFNGDGLTDILNFVDDGYRMLCSDGYGTLIQYATGTFPTKKHHVHTGDFNGDGKTDLLLTGWDGLPSGTTWSEWQIDYSIGNGNFERIYRAKPFEAKDVSLIVTDLNGDGNDDFIAVNDKSAGTSMTKPCVYISNGDHSFTKKAQGDNMYALDKWRYYSGDFNGDGKTDILCTSDWENTNWDGCQIYVMPESTNCLLSSVTDGMGNKTEISYGYMTDNNLCHIKRNVSSPLCTFATSWPMVSSVSTFDGVGGKKTICYTYGTPIFCKVGRGFLCFSSFTQTDETDNTSQTVEYEVFEDVMVPMQKVVKSYCGMNLLSEETNINTLICQNTPYTGRIYRIVTVKSNVRNYEFNSGSLTSEVFTDMDYDQYGQLVSSIMTSGDLMVISHNIYSNDPQSWILGRLLESSVTKTKGCHTSSKSVSFVYDSKTGLLLSECIEPNNREFGLKKIYTRDQFGNILTSEEIPLDGTPSRKVSSTYDARGRFVRSTTDVRGFTKEFYVDEHLGVVNKSTDENGISTEYLYDGFGNLIESTDPLSKTVQTIGWAAGMADAPPYSVYFIHKQTKGGPPYMEFFDCLGRSLRTVSISLGGKKVYSDTAYDRRGHVCKSSEPYFKDDTPFWTYYTYDDVGRLITETDAASNKSEVEYSGLTTTTRDPRGNETIRTVDTNGNLTRIMDALGTSVEYEYDAENRCVKISAPRKEITIEYDIAGNRTDLYDPDMGHVLDSYNAFGELVSHTDEYGTATFTYDNAGRIKKEIRSDCVITTCYDQGWYGKIDKIEFDGDIYSSRRYNYDKYGRIISETTTIEEKSYASKLKYNDNNRICEVEYPNGLAVVQTYDTESCMLTSVSNRTSGLVYWKLKGVNARGQIEEEEFGNGLTTRNQHDKKTGDLTHIITPGVQDWAYTYDSCGNLLSRKDNRRALTETFTYDALCRLKTIDNNGISVRSTIFYDEAGNIAQVGLNERAFSYEEGSNRIKSIEDTSNSIVAWDRIGYNSMGKVSSISMSASGQRVSMAYGVDKTLIKQTTSSFKTTTVEYHPGRLFMEIVRPECATGICYIHAGSRLVAISQQNYGADSGNLLYIHLDHLGSVQAYTDEKGNLVHELSYTAWGRRRNPDTWAISWYPLNTDIVDKHGFCGHEHLDFCGLINMGGRMYDPEVGRFISPDPYVQLPDHTQGFNRYSYCLNNPLSLVDPDGYSWLSKNWKSITASIVGIAVSAVTLGSGSGIGAAIIAGAAGGSASALTGALLNGCNFGEIAKTTFTSALFGAASGFLNFAAADENLLLSLFKHSFSQGWLEGVQGGNAIHGFISGTVAKGGGYVIDRYCSDVGYVGQIAMNATLCGTVDAIGGGNFSNGAITGAFTYLFNESLHQTPSKNKNDTDLLLEAGGVAVALSAADGPLPIGDALGVAVLGGAAVYVVGGEIVDVVTQEIDRQNSKLYITYVLVNPTTGQYYVGRASGWGTKEQVFNQRYSHHHMKGRGFIKKHIDQGAYGLQGRDAIRGREQQLMDFYGGVGSVKLANKIRGVSKYNPLGPTYHKLSDIYFGKKAPYTGNKCIIF